MNAQKSLFHDTAPTLDEIMSAWDYGKPVWMSRKQIAEKLGRAKSPTLIAFVNVAVSLGYLEVKNEVLPNGADYFLYTPTAKYWTDVYPF